MRTSPALFPLLVVVLFSCAAVTARPLIYEQRGNPEKRSKNLEELLFAYDLLSKSLKKGVPVGDLLIQYDTLKVDSDSLTLKAEIEDSLSDEEMSSIAHHLWNQLFEAWVSASEGQIEEMIEKVGAAKERADQEKDPERLKILMAYYASLFPPFDCEPDLATTPRFTWPKDTDQNEDSPKDRSAAAP